MRRHLRKVESAYLLLAVALLAGICVAAYGYWGGSDTAVYAGLFIVGGGVIGGILRLVVRGS